MTDSSSMRIVVLISGSGSNLQSLMDHCEMGYIPGQIVRVISSDGQAYGLTRAARKNIPTQVIEPSDYASRAAFDQTLVAAIDQETPDLICLAGFMRILTPDTVRHYARRLLNIHPSLLPAFPGLHTHQRIIEAGARFSGATVHFVDEGVDTGPIVAQAVVPVLPDDTPDTLAARILKQEHRLYPLAVRWFAEQRICFEGSRVSIQNSTSNPEAVLFNPWERT